MEWILLVVGYGAGLYLWGSVIRMVGLYIPMVRRFKKQGLIETIDINKILIPLGFAAIILIPGYIFSFGFGWGATMGAITMLFNLHNLKLDNWIKVIRDYNLIDASAKDRKGMLKHGFTQQDFELREKVIQERVGDPADTNKK